MGVGWVLGIVLSRQCGYCKGNWGDVGGSDDILYCTNIHFTNDIDQSKQCR